MKNVILIAAPAAGKGTEREFGTVAGPLPGGR